MKILTPEHFIDNSGFAFENLICNFLQEEYGDLFTHTRLTRDGGKDFETIGEDVLTNGHTWAECKKYTQKLSYNDISRTLLMAYLKDINKILLFSYSAVNRCFYKNIAEYRERTSIDIAIYDDENLEKLLLKYRDKKWFSQFINLPSTKENDQEPSIIHDTDIQCLYTLSNEKKYTAKKNKIYINMYEIITVDFVIINRTLDDKIVKIDYSSFENTSEFELLNKKYLIAKGKRARRISKCSAHLEKLYVRIVEYKDIYRLPPIYVNGKAYNTAKVFQTTWLATSGLQGTIYNNYRQDIIEKCNCTPKLFFVMVEGSTGVGKSNFLRDLFQLMHNGEYKCFYCDIDAKSISVQQLCKELFSLFTNLPYFKVSKKNISQLLVTKKENCGMELASEILYNQQFDYSANIDLITNCIFDFLIKSPYFIVIDNIQKYDTLSLKIIQKLIELSSTKNCDSVVVFSYNTNYLIHGTVAFELYNYIHFLGQHKQQRFFVAELPGFDKITAEEYIHTCLQIPKEERSNYNRTVSQIINRVGTNPFMLQNYLIYLCKNSIAKKSNLSFTIVDLPKFLCEADYEKENFTHLMDDIEQNILNSLKKYGRYEDIYVHIVSCLALFRRMNKAFIAVFDEKHIVIDCLIQHGVIQYDTVEGSYQFRHIEYSKYYWGKYNLEYIPCEKTLSYIDKPRFRNRYIESIFLLKYENITKEDGLFYTIENRILDERVPYDFMDMIFNRVLNLYYIGFESPLKKHLHVMKSIADLGTHFLGVDRSICFFTKIYDILVCFPDYFSFDTTIIVSIFKDFLHHLMNEGKLSIAEHYCQEIKKLNKYIANVDAAQNYQLAFAKEEVLVYYKQGKYKYAITIANQLLNDINENSVDHAECLMFLGNVYYREENFLENKAKIRKYWYKAYEIIQEYIPKWRKCDYHMRAILLNIIIKKALVDIFENGQMKNEEYSFFLNIKDHTDMTYFEVKLRQLLSINILMNKNALAMSEDAITMLKDTLDILSTDYGNKAMYSISLFLLAELYKILKDYDKMYDYFLSFYGIFIQLYSYDYQRCNDYYLLVEMCISLRKNKYKYSQTFDIHLLNVLQDQKLYLKLKDILYMPDNEFSLYCQNNSEISLFFCKDKDANYPMI